jgi:hypothetical protein
MVITLLPGQASDGENFAGVVAKRIYSAANEATCCFGGYAEFFANLTKALSLTIM